MSCFQCIGCESGSTCNHWHEPIPILCDPIEMEDWWLWQLETNAPEFAEDAAQTIREWWFYVRMNVELSAREDIP
jgi:hypothetical protein